MLCPNPVTGERVGPSAVDLLMVTGLGRIVGAMPFPLNGLFEVETPETFGAKGIWEVDKESVPEDSTGAEPLCSIRGGAPCRLVQACCPSIVLERLEPMETKGL